jgi:polyisoprenyl-teichoic acid--peptidoglycan teichoic acid transferase
MSHLRVHSSWLLIVLWLLVGCQPAAVPPMPTLAPVAIVEVIAPVELPGAVEMEAAVPPTTLPPTYTPQPTNEPTNTPTSQPTPTLPPTYTPQPTVTPLPTIRAFATLVTTPESTAVPGPMPPFAKGPAITNIILAGNDTPGLYGGRTDSLILVSLNRETKTATMLSLPRDLFVAVPGWRMTKINLALPHGNAPNVDYPGGGGGLIKDTIEYNLGIPVDYYVRIGFDGFKEVIDALGGVEMVVNCSLTDWRLIEPDMDQTVEENWAMFTLEPGIVQMDGDLALWYARSRRSSSDFARGRRQQQVLRAIFNRGLERNAIAQLPELWQIYRGMVETDLTLPLMLELAALAPAVRENGIQHLAIAGDAVRSWREPETGWSMQLLQVETAVPILNRVMQPPELNRATRPPIVVEVVTADPILYRQMAENLAWAGFVPRHATPADGTPDRTYIEYFGPNFKGSYDWLLAPLFQRQPEQIILLPDSESLVNYRVTLGWDANPCLMVNR